MENITIEMDTTFSITFIWKNNSIEIKLDNGEDVLKFAEIFSNMLTKNNISHTIKTKQNETHTN